MRLDPLVLCIAGSLASALTATLVTAPAAQAGGPDLAPPEILSSSVNKGRPIILGPSQTLTFRADVTARAAVGIRRDGVEINFFGPDGRRLDGIRDPAPICTPVSSTTSTCTEWFRIDTGDARVTNGYAGKWRMSALVASNSLDTHPESSITREGNLRKVQVLRASRLTFVVTPNPVLRGRNTNVFGRLMVADWETNRYTGAPGRPVTLETCSGACRVTEALRSLTTGGHGLTGATLPVNEDALWWLRYVGNSEYGATRSPVVWVDAQEPSPGSSR